MTGDFPCLLSGRIGTYFSGSIRSRDVTEESDHRRSTGQRVCSGAPFLYRIPVLLLGCVVPEFLFCEDSLCDGFRFLHGAGVFGDGIFPAELQSRWCGLLCG